MTDTAEEPSSNYDPGATLAALGRVVWAFGFLEDQFMFALRAVFPMSTFHESLLASHVDFGTRIAIFEASVRERGGWPDPPIRHYMTNLQLKRFVDRLYQASKDRNRAVHANYRLIGPISELREDGSWEVVREGQYVEQVYGSRVQRGGPFRVERTEISIDELNKIADSFEQLGRELGEWAYPWMLPPSDPRSLRKSN